MVREKLMEMLTARENEMIQIRRYLHEHPELSFQEKATANYIAKFYEGKEVKVDRNVGNGYGIIVTINEGKVGGTIALRADFDALPIKEQTGLSFASTNEGVMHACGHDAHTAYLLILADCLIKMKDEIPGTIKIIHQNAEEVSPGGAKSMYESGKLADVKQIYGIHFMPQGEPGDILYHYGKSMGGRDKFTLKIQGVGGHGSSPSTSNDPIVAGSHFVTAVQTVVSRRLSPIDSGVVTIGSFDGKGQFNIIPDSVTVEGDIRYIEKNVQTKIHQEVERLAKGLEAMFGVTVTFDYLEDYPVLYNDPEVMAEVVQALRVHEGDKDSYVKALIEAPIVMGSEDFAFFLQKIPGAFLFIGASPQGKLSPYYNHHPKFDIHEKSFLIAAKAVGDIVLHYFGME